MLAPLLLALQSAAAGQQHTIRGLRAGETVQSLGRAAGEDEGAVRAESIGKKWTAPSASKRELWARTAAPAAPSAETTAW